MKRLLSKRSGWKFVLSFAWLLLIHFSAAGAAHYQPLLTIPRPASLFQARDGCLYGAVSDGGISNLGAVFLVPKNSAGYLTLHSFGVTLDDEIYPSDLLEGSDGALYGTTLKGVFRLNKDGTGYSVLHRFTFDEGYYLTGLLEGSDGLLYGTAGDGGFTNVWDAQGFGTVFRVDKTGNGFTVLHAFTFDDQYAGPTAVTLIEGSDSRLYGAIRRQLRWDPFSASVFTLDREGSNFRTLYEFTGVPSGVPGMGVEGFLEGPDGAFYGTTWNGGLNGFGCVFRLTKDGSDCRVVYSFPMTETANAPTGRLAQGPNGALYGTTLWGGESGAGTLFKVKTDGTGYRVLHSFVTGEGYSLWGLVSGTDGAFYGFTDIIDPAGAELFRVWPEETPDLSNIVTSVKSVSVMLAGSAAERYQVLRSTDLKQWTTLDTITPSSSGTTNYLDGSAPLGRAYYRAAWIP